VNVGGLGACSKPARRADRNSSGLELALCLLPV
jgi:hypothetical protein